MKMDKRTEEILKDEALTPGQRAEKLRDLGIIDQSDVDFLGDLNARLRELGKPPNDVEVEGER